MYPHRIAHLPQQRHHRRRTADAIESDHIGAGVGDPLACVGDAPVLARHIGLVHGKRDHRRLARTLDFIERDQRFRGVGECLADNVVDAGVDRPANLFLEHRTDSLVRCGVRGVVDVGVADVAGKESAGFLRDGLGNIERAPVDPLQVLLAPDDPQFLAVRIIGERFDHVRPGVHEVPVQLGHRLRMLEHDFGNERAGLQVAAAFQLEQVTFGTDQGALVEPLTQGSLLPGRLFHGLKPLSE